VLIGHPVAHSLSPLLQNAALERAGLALRYETWDVEPSALRGALATLVAERAAGNVTIPHKAAVFAACARRTALAERVGAVNVFWVDGAALIGDNTDVGGFDRLVRRVIGDASWPARAAVLGAGGWAAAVLAAIAGWGTTTAAIWGRTPATAEALAARFAGTAVAVTSPDAAVADADLVINTTPIGLDDVGLPMPVDRLPPGAVVVDLVYRRGETAWVRAARRAGHRAADGLTMLVEQGALAFERWFGTPPDRRAMWAAVRRV
jgi:shikimate dehydrogenase